MTTPLRPPPPPGVLPGILPTVTEQSNTGGNLPIGQGIRGNPGGVSYSHNAAFPEGPAVLGRPGMVGDLRRSLLPLLPQIDLFECSALQQFTTARIQLARINSDQGPRILVVADGTAYAFNLVGSPSSPFSPSSPSSEDEFESPYVGTFTTHSKILGIHNDGCGGTFEIRARSTTTPAAIGRYNPEGRCLWEYTFKDYISPSVVDAGQQVLIYAGSQFIYLDRNSGQIVKAINTDSSVYTVNSMAKFSDGRLLVANVDKVMYLSLHEQTFQVQSTLELPYMKNLGDLEKATQSQDVGVAIDPFSEEVFIALGEGIYVFHPQNRQLSFLQLPEMPPLYTNEGFINTIVGVSAFHLDPDTRYIHVVRERFREGALHQRILDNIPFSGRRYVNAPPSPGLHAFNP